MSLVGVDGIFYNNFDGNNPNSPGGTTSTYFLKTWGACLDMNDGLSQIWATEVDLFIDEIRIKSTEYPLDLPVAVGWPIIHKSKIYWIIPWYDSSWVTAFSETELWDGGKMRIYELNFETGEVLNKLQPQDSINPDLRKEGTVYRITNQNEMIASGNYLFWLEGNWVRRINLSEE